MSRAAEVTYAVTTAATPSASEAQTLADTCQTIWVTRFAGFTDSEVSILPPIVRLGDGSTTPFEATALGAASPGTNITSYPPPQVAILGKKITGVGGRKNRGRMYFPFMLSSSNLSENGTVDPTALAAYQTQFNDFLTDLSGTPSPMVIANKTWSSPVPPRYVTEVTTGPAVTTLSVESLIGTQRRRMAR